MNVKSVDCSHKTSFGLVVYTDIQFDRRYVTPEHGHLTSYKPCENFRHDGLCWTLDWLMILLKLDIAVHIMHPLINC